MARRKLYLTHEPAELVMAWMLANAGVVLLWLAFNAPERMPFVVVWIAGNIGALCVGMVCVFLFTLSGSRKRREADEAKSRAA